MLLFRAHVCYVFKSGFCCILSCVFMKLSSCEAACNKKVWLSLESLHNCEKIFSAVRDGDAGPMVHYCCITQTALVKDGLRLSIMITAIVLCTFTPVQVTLT